MSIENPQDKENIKTPESLERKFEVVQDIRDKYGILFITCQPKEVWEELGITEDKKWFVDALGLPEDTQRVKTVYAPGEKLPNTIEESGVIIGGSIHSVYQKDTPWIRKLEEFVRAVASKNIPMLGVCFGHQLITQAFGGKIEKGNAGRELGITNIDLTQEGMDDPLYQDVKNSFEIATSHADAVTKIPEVEKTAVLASNAAYANQSFSIGEKIRTVQFHPEIQKPTILKIVQARKQALINEGLIKDEHDFEEYMEKIGESEIEKHGRQIIRNFDRNFILKYLLKHE